MSQSKLYGSGKATDGAFGHAIMGAPIIYGPLGLESEGLCMCIMYSEETQVCLHAHSRQRIYSTLFFDSVP